VLLYNNIHQFFFLKFVFDEVVGQCLYSMGVQFVAYSIALHVVDFTCGLMA